ncbi:hypothetical protein ACIRL3_46470 [Streptomyces sp. NPDC102384]|uniref:hypothetical protein n=1 Tax=Streptomyces sp. NPDC102384 TaxID=3366166 RepID=UPI00382D1198
MIEHGTRRIRILAMDLADAGAQARFLIQDWDMKHPALIDKILTEADIHTVLTSVRIPWMNSITER